MRGSRVVSEGRDRPLTDLPPFDDADLFDEAGYLRLYPGIMHAMMQGVNLIIGFDHGFRQCAITVLQRVEAALDHRACGRCHPLDVTVHIERAPAGAVTQARADINRLVADAFQIGRNLETRHYHAKVPRGRLIQGKDADATLIDFTVETVNGGIARSNRRGPGGIARKQAADGVANLIADQFAHAQERISQLR